jgi:hypothetical protein
MHKQHKDSNQIVGGPPSKSWLLPKIQPRNQQLKFTMKTQKRIFGNVKTQNRVKHVCPYHTIVYDA